MKAWLVELLECPSCRGGGDLICRVDMAEGDEIESGALSCPSCGGSWPILRGIPRFVGSDENYAQAFGWQWNHWRTLQVDRLSGHFLTERRFLTDSRWSKDWLKGRLILDAGCGAGRFTDAAAQLGAQVVACDLSSAVDACRATCRDSQGHRADRGEVVHLQANLLDLPFKAGVFDGVFCMGVIQHTPDPARVMSALPAHLKPGGRLAYNFYEANSLRRLEVVKYGLRRITPDWSEERLLLLCRLLVALFFPLTLVMSRIPVVRAFTRFVPISATHPPDLTLVQQWEWTLLDTFDWLNPRYEICQDHREVAMLLRGLGLGGVESSPGLAWAVRPENDVRPTAARAG